MAIFDGAEVHSKLSLPSRLLLHDFCVFLFKELGLDKRRSFCLKVSSVATLFQNHCDVHTRFPFWCPAGGASLHLRDVHRWNRANKNLSAVCHLSQVNVWPSANCSQEPGADSAPLASPRCQPANRWAHFVKPFTTGDFFNFPRFYLFHLQLDHTLILIIHRDNWNWFCWSSLKVPGSPMRTTSVASSLDTLRATLVNIRS